MPSNTKQLDPLERGTENNFVSNKDIHHNVHNKMINNCGTVPEQYFLATTKGHCFLLLN